MEYRRELGSIQADLARRAGALLQQYAQLAGDLPAHRRLDATLAISVLNLLLANCSEALRVLEDDGRMELLWQGLRPTLLDMASNNFPPLREGSMEVAALNHLRNAVSHPVPNRAVLSPVTGYVSFTDGDSGRVDGFEFTSSPWTDHTGAKVGRSPTRGKVVHQLKRFAGIYDCRDLEVSSDKDPGGSFVVVERATQEPYLPVFSLKLSLPEVEAVAVMIANFLAHGSLSGWDGEVLEDLLSA